MGLGSIGSPNSISHFDGSGTSPSGPSQGNVGVTTYVIGFGLSQDARVVLAIGGVDARGHATDRAIDRVLEDRGGH